LKNVKPRTGQKTPPDLPNLGGILHHKNSSSSHGLTVLQSM
jgi:hypothetical protein